MGRKLFKKVYTFWSERPLRNLSLQNIVDKVEADSVYCIDNPQEVVDEADWHEHVEDWLENKDPEEEEEEEEEDEDESSSPFDQRGQNVKNQFKF